MYQLLGDKTQENTDKTEENNQLQGFVALFHGYIWLRINSWNAKSEINHFFYVAVSG